MVCLFDIDLDLLLNLAFLYLGFKINIGKLPSRLQEVGEFEKKSLWKYFRIPRNIFTNKWIIVTSGSAILEEMYFMKCSYLELVEKNIERPIIKELSFSWQFRHTFVKRSKYMSKVFNSSIEFYMVHKYNSIFLILPKLIQKSAGNLRWAMAHNCQ